MIYRIALHWISRSKETASILAKHLEIESDGEDPTEFVQFAAEKALEEVRLAYEEERHKKELEKIRGLA